MNFEFKLNQPEQKESREKSPIESSIEFLKDKWETTSQELKQITGVEITDKEKLKEALAGVAAITTAHGMWEMGDRLLGMEPFQFEGHLLLDTFVLSPFIYTAIKDAIEAIKLKRRTSEGSIEA